MNPLPLPIKLTYEDLLEFPEDGKRHELLDGEHVVSPSPFVRHQQVQMNLIRLLAPWVHEHQIGQLFASPFDTVLSNTDVLEPDLCFVATAHLACLEAGRHLMGSPDLAVEILSEWSRRRDEVTKRRIYEKFGVPEYWIVDPELETVKIYRAEASGYGPASLIEGESSFESPLFAGLSISLAEVFWA